MKLALKESLTENLNSSRLGDLNCGEKGVVVATPGETGMDQRLLEMGLLEGAEVEIMHEAPLSRDPIVVRVRGTLIALRRNEANRITVRVISTKGKRA